MQPYEWRVNPPSIGYVFSWALTFLCLVDTFIAEEFSQFFFLASDHEYLYTDYFFCSNHMHGSTRVNML